MLRAWAPRVIMSGKWSCFSLTDKSTSSQYLGRVRLCLLESQYGACPRPKTVRGPCLPELALFLLGFPLECEKITNAPSFPVPPKPVTRSGTTKPAKPYTGWFKASTLFIPLLLPFHAPPKSQSPLKSQNSKLTLGFKM